MPGPRTRVEPAKKWLRRRLIEKDRMKSISGYLRTRSLRRRLEQPPVIFMQEAAGVEILFSVHTWLEYHNRARDSYTGEPETVDWIRSNLRAGDTLWDVGANVGAYSLLAPKLVPGSAVVVLERYIPTFAHLWKNIAINRCENQITPLCVALSEHSAVDRYEG